MFGLFGAFLVLQRRLGRSAAGMYVVIGINAVLGFVIPGIAWQAHLGGLVAGAAGAAVFGYLGRADGPAAAARPRAIHWAGLAAHPASCWSCSTVAKLRHRPEAVVHRLVRLWITPVSFIHSGDNPCGQPDVDPSSG